MIRQDARAWRSSPEGHAKRIEQGERRRERMKAEGRSVSGNPYKPPDLAWRDRLWAAHRMRPEDWQAIWNAQDGRCYLCGDELERGRHSHIDHDHRCCGPERSCGLCRRGIACADCNASISRAHDDPERLRRIADRLEAAKLAVSTRLSARYVQGEIDFAAN